MRDRSTKRQSGFSLLEMTVALGLGGIVLAAAVQIYVQGVSATWTTAQRSELQQDFRAASNILTKDLSLAGSGLNPGAAIALPSGVTPVYGCDQSGTCYINGTSVAYPKQGATAFLYGLLPGYNVGPTLSGTSTTDAITVVYTDSSFYLNCYTATVTSATVVTFTLPGTTSTNCTAPGGNAGAQAVSDSAAGLTPGDLVWLTFPGPNNIIAEVTTAATGGGLTTFAASDKLKMNQAAGVANSLASMYVASPPAAALTTGFAQRIFVITYYIDNTAATPRLMQQVSGHTPVPVAESVVYLKFTYDVNVGASLPAVNCSNPGAASDGCGGASTGVQPNQVMKINIQNMAMDGSQKGNLFGQGKGYQRMSLQTSVCPRNLTYVNNYLN
jgi:prepilin-type N-terminal cleavage/methylation domain-containing protein